MRVLMVSLRLPRTHEPATSRAGRLAPVARQIISLRALGIDVEVLEIAGLRVLKYLVALFGMWRRAGSYDLIHAHYGFCGWVARAQSACPVVVSFMGSDVLGARNDKGQVTFKAKLEVLSNCILSRLVDAVIVKSEQMASLLAPVVATVVPNGVDLASFCPMPKLEARQVLGWHPTRKYLLFPGNPSDPVKGFALAQEAVRIVQERTREEVELAVLWAVAPENVPLYMNAADVMILTSFSEGSPNVVKEALACNLPVVSLPVGDVPELLEGVEKCHVVTGNAETLGTTIAAELHHGRATNGRAVLHQKGLDLASVAKRVLAVYESVPWRFPKRTGHEQSSTISPLPLE